MRAPGLPGEPAGEIARPSHAALALRGRTDLANLVLLCDADHGLVHDLHLVMTRRGGEVIVLDHDGRRVWGRADAAFVDGLDGGDEVEFVGVQPLDELAGRRPPSEVEQGSCRVTSLDAPRRRRRPTASARAALGSAGMARVLFPGGEPPALPDSLESGGERMSMAWAVSVLMDNRDVARRLAADPDLAL